MPSASSSNKNYELMATGENNGTWGTKTNANLSIVDLNFGGRLNLSVAGSSDVTVTNSQAQNLYHKLTGVLTGNISYILPTVGSYYIIDNQTSGSFSITVKMSTGLGVVVPQGSRISVFSNPDIPAVVGTVNNIGYTLPISQGGTGATTAGEASVNLLNNSFIGGTSTGSANAQAVVSTNPGTFVRTAGYRLLWTPGFTNTGALTLNEDSHGAAAVQKITPSGLSACSGGEVISGTPTVTEWNGTNWVLLNNPTEWGGPYTNLASASTTDLGSIPSRSVSITGTTTINSFGSSASLTYPLYFITFSSSLTLTYNASSLIIPGSSSITTVSGDSAIVQYLGSGNWRVIQYQRAGAEGTIDPASMAGLSSPLGLIVRVTSDTAVDVDATQVSLTSGSSVYIAKSVNLTISISSSGANGLDTGSEAANTWYYVYVIYNPLTSTVAGLLSASSTSPTLPSGYSYYRRVGSVRNNSSSNLYRTLKKNSRSVYTVGTNPTTYIEMITGASGSISTPSWTSVSVNSFVPTTANVIYLSLRLEASSVSNGAMAAPSNAYGAYDSANNPPPMVIAEGTNGTAVPNVQTSSFLLESTNVYYASSSSAAGMYVMGWEEDD